MFYKDKKSGFILIEIIVGLAIILVCFVGIFSTINISLKVVGSDTQNIKTGMLLEEGIEAIKSMRVISWNDKIKILATSTNYYLFFDNNNNIWQTTTTPVFIDSLERKIFFEDVYRNSNDDIAPSGTLDQNTKKITVSVSWGAGIGTTTNNLSAYITNLFNN